MFSLFKKSAPAEVSRLREIQKQNEADRERHRKIAGRMAELEAEVLVLRDALRKSGDPEVAAEYVAAFAKRDSQRQALEVALQLSAEALARRCVERSLAPTRDCLRAIERALQSKITQAIEGDAALAQDLDVPECGESPIVRALRSKLGSVNAALERLANVEADADKPVSARWNTISGCVSEALGFAG